MAGFTVVLDQPPSKYSCTLLNSKESTTVGVSHLKLPDQEVSNHLPAGDDHGAVEGRYVEGAGQAVGEAEEEHGRDPAAGVLEREAALGHLVLLHDAPLQVVHAAGRVDLGLELAGDVGPLLARQDVEVVVRRVSPRVAFGADGRAEDDEILGDA